MKSAASSGEDFLWCRCSRWLWSSAGSLRCSYFHVEPRGDQTLVRSLIQLVPLQTGRLFKLRLWTPASREPSKVSYNNPACDPVGAPCSHYKGSQRACPGELCLTSRLCTSAVLNNRVSVFVSEILGGLVLVLRLSIKQTHSVYARSRNSFPTHILPLNTCGWRWVNLSVCWFCRSNEFSLGFLSVYYNPSGPSFGLWGFFKDKNTAVEVPYQLCVVGSHLRYTEGAWKDLHFIKW